MELFQQIIAFFMAVIAAISSFFTGLFAPKKVDMTQFELVWSDEFDGDAIDADKWQIQRNTMMRRGGYWNTDLATVRDGCLTIETKYLPEGVNEGDPAGWYSARLRTKGLYEQTYGYFEIRCKLPRGAGLWSAFWMQNTEAMDAAYDDGSYGSEIDIMEAPYSDSDDPNRYSGAVHWGGYGEKHRSVEVKSGSLDADLYNTFNTYGLEWNAEEYIFYFNGEQIGKLDKRDLVPSQAPEHLLLTVEVGGENGVPAESWAQGVIEENGRDFVGAFVIDYVRAYQYR